MLEGIDIDLDYKQLMEKLVCSMDNEKYCMLINVPKRKCQNCPSSDDLFDYLMDNIHEEEVTCKEWKASKETNTQLVSTTQNVTDFIPKLINLLKKLVTHHFINKSQNKYFKKLKSNLGKRECVILLEFAENYSSVNQVFKFKPLNGRRHKLLFIHL